MEDDKTYAAKHFDFLTMMLENPFFYDNDEYMIDEVANFFIAGT